jgi:cell wall-associated NlpC family hydrolase
MLTCPLKLDYGSIIDYKGRTKRSTMRIIISTLFVFALFSSFGFRKEHNQINLITPVFEGISVEMPSKLTVSESALEAVSVPVITANTAVDAIQFVNYAMTLIGTPYVYGSTDPAVGFDCSGFINHVAKNFGMTVPRSSVDFTNVGTEVTRELAKPGDLILFTGTDPSTRVVGHMGIITQNPGGGAISFVHSTSGKAKGVTVSELEGYYDTRFVKVIRIFPLSQNKIVA